MKVIIQCAGSKSEKAKPFFKDGKRIEFVARPKLKEMNDIVFCRPEDPVDGSSRTWIDELLDYNHGESNPFNLCKAYELYDNEIYRKLNAGFGGNFYILSAGWGLIRGDLLIPNYDITFASGKDVEKVAVRLKREFEPKALINHLANQQLGSNEPIHVFAGKKYIPLLSAMTEGLRVHLVLHYQGKKPSIPDACCCEYRGDPRNWQYQAAKAFLAEHDPAGLAPTTTKTA